MAVSTIDALYSAGIVNLDSSFSSGTLGGIIRLSDAGTQFADLHEDSGNFLISSAQVDKDIIFKGNDGGSVITAMTIDMSAGGNVGIGSPPAHSLHIEKAGTQFIFLNNASTNDGFYFKAGTGASSIQTNGGSNVMNFFTSGNERMKIDSSGAVTMPAQPAFSATKSTKQSNVAVNSQVTVVFETEVFDQNNDFAGSQFTAPVTGKYQLNLSLYTNELDSAADYYIATIKTSNREYQNVIDPGVLASDPVYWNQGVSVLADMDANDTAYVFIQQGNGNQQTDVATPSFFSGYLVA